MALALHPPPSRDRVARLRTVYGRHSASRRGGVRRKRGRGGRDAREGQDIATAYPHAARPRSLANRYAMAATIGAMRPAPAELEVAQALIARVKAADPSLKRVDELLVCAPHSRMLQCGQTSLAACPTLRSGDGQEHLEAEAGDRLGRSA